MVPEVRGQGMKQAAVATRSFLQTFELRASTIKLGDARNGGMQGEIGNDAAIRLNSELYLSRRSVPFQWLTNFINGFKPS